MLTDSTLLLAFFGALVAGNLWSFYRVAHFAMAAVTKCEIRADQEGARAIRFLTKFAAWMMLAAIALESVIVVNLDPQAENWRHLFFGALFVLAMHGLYTFAVRFLLGAVMHSADADHADPQGVPPAHRDPQ